MTHDEACAGWLVAAIDMELAGGVVGHAPCRLQAPGGGTGNTHEPHNAVACTLMMMSLSSCTALTLSANQDNGMSRPGQGLPLGTGRSCTET